MEVNVVVDAPYTLKRTPKKICIRGVNVVPYTSANIMVSVYYEEESSASFIGDDEVLDGKVKHLTVPMNTEKYSLWKDDDDYLVDFVLEYLGMKRA